MTNSKYILKKKNMKFSINIDQLLINCITKELLVDQQISPAEITNGRTNAKTRRMSG